jgi:hypothetical protein
MKTPQYFIKKRGYDDDCSPNTVTEMASLMRSYNNYMMVELTSWLQDNIDWELNRKSVEELIIEFKKQNK